MNKVMKQTAVEWLIENVLLQPTTKEEVEHNISIFKIAKELEKQQIEEANERGFVVGRKDIGETAVDYYEKTFKNL